MRKYLYPTSGRAEIATVFRLALAGMLIAGTFGILHDQITYTISPEYFTRMKFSQFKAWDFGFPRRVFVAEIGFLATWWVGLIGTWFLARIAVLRFENPLWKVFQAVLVMIGITSAFAMAGYFTGPSLYQSRDGWSEDLKSIGVTDMVSFNRVAAVHLGSYVGALVGWLVMMTRFVLTKPSGGFPLAQSGNESQPGRSDG